MADDECTKLDGAPGVVNLAAPLAAPLVAALLSAACLGGNRPAPVELPGTDWRTPLGNVERSGYAEEPAPEITSVAWRSEVGRGLLTPLLVEGPVIISAASDGRVAAVSAETGEAFWSRDLDGALTGGLVRSDDLIFAATEARSGRMYALDPREGEVVWSREVGSSPFAPLVVDRTVYVATDDGVHALDAGDGGTVWRTALPASAASTPLPSGPHLLVASKADTLYLLDRTDGGIRARHAVDAAVSAAPALLGDTLVVPLHNGEVLALELPAMREIWRERFDDPVFAAPAAAPDGTLYLLTRAADLWRVPAGSRNAERVSRLGGAARGSLTLARDRLLVGRLDGTLLLLRPDGEVVWTRELEGSIAAPVTVRNGAVYVPLLNGQIVQLR